MNNQLIKMKNFGYSVGWKIERAAFVKTSAMICETDKPSSVHKFLICAPFKVDCPTV